MDIACVCINTSIAIRMAMLGASHFRLADALHSIGLVYEAEGNLDYALDSYQNVLVVRQRSLGPNHPDVQSLLQIINRLQCYYSMRSICY